MPPARAVTGAVTVSLVAFACDPSAGSEPYNGWRWASTLLEQGYRVRLVTRLSNREQVEGGRSQLADSDRLVVQFIPDASGLLFPHLPHRAAMYANYAQFLRRASTIIEADAPSIVHHVTWGSFNFGTVRVPRSVALIWGPVGGSQLTNRTLRPLFPAQWSWERVRNLLVTFGPSVLPQIRRSTRRADVVLATNLQTKSAAERLGARDVRLLIADALADVPEPRTPTGTNVLWVGRMLPIKGASLAVEAFAQLSRHLPSATMTMVGDGPEMTRVKAAIRRHGLGRRVTLTGTVPREDVEKYYRAASLFLFSSLRDSFGAQILEAARHSLPLVLLSHQGAAGALPAGAAAVVDTDPVSNLAQRLGLAMESVLTDSDRAAWMAKNAYEVAKINTWQCRGELVKSLYADVIGSGGPHA